MKFVELKLMRLLVRDKKIEFDSSLIKDSIFLVDLGKRNKLELYYNNSLIDDSDSITVNIDEISKNLIIKIYKGRVNNENEIWLYSNCVFYDYNYCWKSKVYPVIENTGIIELTME